MYPKHINWSLGFLGDRFLDPSSSPHTLHHWVPSYRHMTSPTISTLMTQLYHSSLLVAARIQFKTLMLAYRTTTGSEPTYFHSLLRIYIPSRSLRSASERRLMVPSQRGSKSLSRTFSFTVSGWWNDLPTPIRSAGSLSIFKQQLKTHLFQHYFT